MKKLLFMFLVLCFSVLALSTANPEITFAVLSDIHSKPDPLKNALIDLKSINPELTALILNGDTVDLGQPEDYA
ncbi:MAG TPA: metallophosphoesterase family protein, partial [Petrotogaceae bacterium]|nr:metallophosphoesterase family protein [Petrotogaceae bacterium]